MLKGIDPILTGDLLKVLAEMGHGNEICLADANFPAKEVAGAKPLVWARGANGPRVLKAVLSVLPLDSFDAACSALSFAPSAFHTLASSAWRRAFARFPSACVSSFSTRATTACASPRSA